MVASAAEFGSLAAGDEVEMSDALDRLRARARVLRDRVVDQQLRQLERVRHGLLRGEVDVLVMGESSCILGRPGERETATIPQLLGRRLDARVAHFVGPGFSPRMYSEALRILGTLDVRPEVVVTSICVRTSTATHVVDHPVYAHERSYQAMRRIGSARSRIGSVGGVPRPTVAEYAAFEALPVQTRWGGASTVGDFRRRLKGHGPLPWPGGLEAVLFDYYHGELLETDNRGLGQWRGFGEHARRYGTRFVGYRTPIPVGQGVAHHGPDFAEFTASKRALVDAAVCESAGPGHVLVDPQLDDEEFADQRDGTEHYAYSGRLRVVEAVAAAIG